MSAEGDGKLRTMVYYYGEEIDPQTHMPVLFYSYEVLEDVAPWLTNKGRFAVILPISPINGVNRLHFAINNTEHQGDATKLATDYLDRLHPNLTKSNSWPSY